MWNLLRNNYLCDEKELLRTSQIHLEKLLNTKSNISTKGPKTPLFLKNKSYLKELIRTKQRNIKINNNIMYNKLISVSNSPSIYSKFNNIPKYCPAFDKKKFNYKRIEREKNISYENRTFFDRFIKRRPTYSTKNFMRQSCYERYIRNNISRTKFLPNVSLKLCTFREFKSNLMKESDKMHDMNPYLNETKLNDHSNTTMQNNFNNPIYFNSNINNSLSKTDLYNKMPSFKKKINNMKRSQSVKHKYNKIIDYKNINCKD